MRPAPSRIPLFPWVGGSVTLAFPPTTDHLTYLATNKLVISRPLLGQDDFVDLCKKCRLPVTEDRLRGWEEIGLFFPLARGRHFVTYHKVIEGDVGQGRRVGGPVEPEEEWAGEVVTRRRNLTLDDEQIEYLTAFLEEGRMWAPGDSNSGRSEAPVKSQADSNIESFYSLFQVYSIAELVGQHRDALRLDVEDLTSMTEQQWTGHFGWMQGRVRDKLRLGRSMIEITEPIAFVCQVLSNRYYPYTQSNRRLIHVSGWYEHYDWNDYQRQWAAHRVLEDLNLTTDAVRDILVEARPVSADAWGKHPWPVLGSGTTDSNGYIHVDVARPAVSDIRLVANGMANIQISVVNAQGQPVPILSLPRYTGTDPDLLAEAAGIVADNTHVQLTPTLMHMVRARASRASLRPMQGCFYYWQQYNSTNSNTVVGELHARYWASDARFTYGRNADSSIGVDITGSSGQWTANGAITISNGTSQATGIDKYSEDWGHQIQLPFHYEEDAQYNSCIGPTYTYQAYATQWNGGFGAVGLDKSQYDGLYYQSNASTMVPGAFYSRTSKSSVKYSVGVTVFGAGLSTQSGYSQYVELKWTARSDNGGYGCLYGSHGDVIATAGIIYAGPYGSSGCT